MTDMKFIVLPMFGGYRWILRDGVNVAARGPVQIGDDAHAEAFADAAAFKAGVSKAEIDPGEVAKGG